MTRGAAIFLAVAGLAGVGIFLLEKTGTFSGIVSTIGIGNLSFDDLRTIAAAAGFDDPDTAAAIALAESSGNPNAVGDTSITPGGSIGLWQINLSAHPEYSSDSLKDPVTNANAAFAVYSDAGSFQPWSTYNDGSYQKYMPSGS